jgi:hypothetical protein
MYIYDFTDYIRKCLWNYRRPGINEAMKDWYVSEAEKTIKYVEECIKQQEALYNEKD